MGHETLTLMATSCSRGIMLSKMSIKLIIDRTIGL